MEWPQKSCKKKKETAREVTVTNHVLLEKTRGRLGMSQRNERRAVKRNEDITEGVEVSRQPQKAQRTGKRKKKANGEETFDSIQKKWTGGTRGVKRPSGVKRSACKRGWIKEYQKNV